MGKPRCRSLGTGSEQYTYPSLGASCQRSEICSQGPAYSSAARLAAGGVRAPRRRGCWRPGSGAVPGFRKPGTAGTRAWTTPTRGCRSNGSRHHRLPPPAPRGSCACDIAREYGSPVVRAAQVAEVEPAVAFAGGQQSQSGRAQRGSNVDAAESGEWIVSGQPPAMRRGRLEPGRPGWGKRRYAGNAAGRNTVMHSARRGLSPAPVSARR